MKPYNVSDSDLIDLHSRLASWFGDDRQAFLASDLAPVINRIAADAYMAGLAAAFVCEWCGAPNGTHANGCRLGLGPDERGTHRPDCNCAPPYADCGHPACDCTECVYDCRGLCGDHQWLDRPESDTHECAICGIEEAG